MSTCFSECYPQGPYARCCYTDGIRGSSLLQGPANKPVATPCAMSPLCRGTAGPGSDTAVPGHGWQHVGSSQGLAEQCGVQGPCLPNHTKQHLLFTAPTTSSKNTKRGIMMTHEKQKSHNFQKLVNHQLQSPVPTAWNAL